MTRRAVRRPTHPFTQAVHPDWAGRPVCDCGQLRGVAVHQMPATDPAVTEQEARRLGEREDHPDA